MYRHLLHDAPLSFRLADGDLPPALLLTPRGFEPNYSYPLLLVLHDDGKDERQWEGLLPGLSDRNYLAAAPRAPLPGGAGYSWGFDTDGVAGAAERLAESFPVNPRRIFALGVGAGGGAALRLALARPELFAGAVAFNPRGNATSLAAAWRRRSPAGFLVLHGRESPAAGDAKEWAARLHVGGQSVAHFAFPGGAGTTAGMLRTANRWLMDRVVAPLAGHGSSASVPKP